jgi:hypothetical protein
MRTYRWIFLLFLLALIPCSVTQAQSGGVGSAPKAKADMAATRTPEQIFYNAKIYTGEGMAESSPRVVEAIAVGGGKVLAVGSNAEIRKLAGPKTKLYDVDTAHTGTAIFPGFNDAHVHLGMGGRMRLAVDLTGTPSLDAMLAQVEAAAKAAPAGHWLTGGNWDHTLWTAVKLPTRQDLDRVTGTHPTFLSRIDGHIGVANTAALKAAGITGKTAAPEGGAIDLDAAGEPTGILREGAQSLVEKIEPPPTMEERRHAAEVAIADALSHGITSVQDNSDWEDFLTFEQMEKEGKLHLRITEWLAFSAPIKTLKTERAHHAADDPLLHTGMLKGFMDGSLGSRTAAMKAAFADEAGNTGLPQYAQTELDKMTVERAAAGFQMGFHAIGDKAAAMALDAFQQSYDVCPELAPQDKNPYKVERCWPLVAKGARDRVEHAQVVDPADIPRFAKLGVIASMQPNHLLTDMNWAESRLGPERAAYSYAWKAFLDAGVRLAFGTDYPVEPITPYRGLYAAVTRQSEDGKRSYFPENKLTRGQALTAYTQGSAYAEFAEKRKGKLEAGFDADFILVDRDLYTVDAPAILTTKVRETWVAGQQAWTADTAKH